MKKLFFLLIIITGFILNSEAQQVEVRVQHPGASVTVRHGRYYHHQRHQRNGRIYYTRHYHNSNPKGDYHRTPRNGNHRGHGDENRNDRQRRDKK